MESVLMGHPERDMPFCVRDVKITAAAMDDSTGTSGPSSATILSRKTIRTVAEIIGNHQTRRVVTLEAPVTTNCLEIHLIVPSTTVPAALFAVRCYGG
jgi:hypothetical protein